MAAIKSLGTELTDDTKRFMKTFANKYVEYIVFDRIESRLKTAVTKALNDAKTDATDAKSDEKTDNAKEDNANTDTDALADADKDTAKTKVDEKGTLPQPPEDESEPPKDDKAVNDLLKDSNEIENENENENVATETTTQPHPDEDDEMEPETPAHGKNETNDEKDETSENNNDNDEDTKNALNENENENDNENDNDVTTAPKAEDIDVDANDAGAGADTEADTDATKDEKKDETDTKNDTNPETEEDVKKEREPGAKENETEAEAGVTESKEESKDEEKKELISNNAKGILHLLPIINVACEKTEKEKGPDGDEYTAYKLIFVKLSNDSENPSRCGIKLSRFRKLHSFNDSFLKFLKESESIPRNKELYEQLKATFPGKTMPWTNNKDPKLIEERKEKIDKYMDICSNDPILSHEKLFQEFFGLKDDEDFVSRMKLFHKALLKACEADNRFPPSPWELAKYDDENDQLICTMMHILQDKISTKTRIILGDTTGKTRNLTNKAISKTCGKAVSGSVSMYWRTLKAARSKIIEGVDKALEGENGEKLNKVLDKAANLAAPIVKKVFNKDSKKKDKNNDKDKDSDSKNDENDENDTETETENKNEKEDEEEFKYDLSIDDIVSLREFKEELSKNLEGNWLEILSDYDKKSWNMLINHFELEREKHFEYDLKSMDYLPDFGKIEYNHRSRVCRSVVLSYRFVYAMIKDTLSEFFEYLLKNFSQDCDLSKFVFKEHCDAILSILRKNGNIIATKVSEAEASVMQHLHGMTPTGGSKMLDKPKKLGGFVGNFVTQMSVELCSLADTTNETDNESNIKNITWDGMRQGFLDVLIKNFEILMLNVNKELFDGIYDATYADMCTIIEKDLEDALESLERHGLEALDFLPDIVTKYVSFVSILEKVTDIATEIILKKKLKPKRKALETKFYNEIKKQ